MSDSVRNLIIIGSGPTGYTASLAIHRPAGFGEVDRRERIAQLDGVGRDTILVEGRR